MNKDKYNYISPVTVLP